MDVTYPAAPWRLKGRLVIAGAPLPPGAADTLVRPPLRQPPSPGRALAVLLLGSYGEGSTLRYGELAGMVGPMLVGARPGGLVTSTWVDDVRSVAGGRERWGLPKELATLDWGPEAADVRDSGGAPIARARWRERSPRLPVPVAAPFIGVLGGAMRYAWLVGIVCVAPTRVELEIPDDSPLAPLGLGGRRLGLAGRLDVLATAPRNVSAA